MCRYGEHHYKSHYVFLSCRVGVKSHPLPLREHPCRECGQSMIHAGRDLAVPRRGDRDAWDALAAVLHSGHRYDSCGCSGPGYRPRARAEVRDRLMVARRRDIPIRDALIHPDPLHILH